jgi:hypothetical protein
VLADKETGDGTSSKSTKCVGLLCCSYYLVQVFAGQFSYLENSPWEGSIQKRQFFSGLPDEEIETLPLAITGNKTVFFIKLVKKSCRASFRAEADRYQAKSQRNCLWKICNQLLLKTENAESEKN